MVIFSGTSSLLDLCHVAPSQTTTKISFGNSSCSLFRKAAYILCYNMESPKRNFHPSSAQPHHNIPIFANMVAWNARTMPSFAPATLCLVDTPKSRFVLEHQAYSFCLILDCQKPYGIANFLRLQSPRRPPFWDALRAASPCASRAFLASCKYNCCRFLFLFYASKACFISCYYIFAP